MRWLLALVAASLWAQPVVSKIEPPSWWTGSRTGPLRMLVRGEGLAGAKVTAPAGKASVSNLKVSAKGTYLFFDLAISTRTPGPLPLTITTPGGTAAATFQLLAPFNPGTNFQGFSADDVVYLIMPDRFSNGDPANDNPAKAPNLLDRSKSRYYHGGDLAGIIDRLPYLKSLGVTAIWFTPVYDNVDHLNQWETYNGQAITDYHGYGAVDFYNVDEHLGSHSTLRDLVARAHSAGIKVIQDQVANHTGPYHPWVLDSPTPSWYNGTAASHLANTWQTWTIMDPHARADIQRATLEGWFANILPDLNQNDPEVRRYLIQNALWWVGTTGLDGIRQDTWPYVPRDFWRDWMAALKKEFPTLRVVGEFFDGDPALVAFSQGGRKGWDGIDTGVDSLFDFPLYYPLRRAFAEGKSLRDIPKMLAHDSLYPQPERLVTFLGLHDVKRFMNEPGATLAGLKLAYTFLLTARGIPLIYYGDEIGLPGGEDPDNRRDFPGGWLTDSRNAFTAEGRSEEQQDLWNHVAALTKLRQELPALRRGKTEHLVTEDQLYAYTRKDGAQTVLVVLNNDNKSALVSIPVAGSWQHRWQESDTVSAKEGQLELTIPARSARILLAR